MKHFIHGLPKAELHLHFEGTLEPEMALDLAARNSLALPYQNVDEVKTRMGCAYDLPTFIAVYEELLSVIRTEQDFYEVAYAYFVRSHSQNVVYAEMFFDPQMHTTRGIALETVINGIHQAQVEAERKLGLRSQLIMCFNRDRSAESAMAILEQSIPYKEKIVGIGLDNPEEENFPAKFNNVYSRARKMGYRLTSHCDVNQLNTIQHLWGCLNDLRVERIDHGVNVLEDENLIETVKKQRIGLTVCPTILYTDTPNRFQYDYFDLCAEAVRKMLDLGLLVALNTDDPGFMCSQYLGDVYITTQERLNLSKEQLVTLARNSFEIAWLADDIKQQYGNLITAYMAAN